VNTSIAWAVVNVDAAPVATRFQVVAAVVEGEVQSVEIDGSPAHYSNPRRAFEAIDRVAGPNDPVDREVMTIRNLAPERIDGDGFNRAMAQALELMRAADPLGVRG